MRIISELCIGILKRCFQWLQSIHLSITNNKNSIQKILELIEATILLHNMLIDYDEDDKDDWIDCDDFSEIDDAEMAPYLPGNALYEAILVGAPKDERRTRLIYYFKEHFYFKYIHLLLVQEVLKY